MDYERGLITPSCAAGRAPVSPLHAPRGGDETERKSTVAGRATRFFFRAKHIGSIARMPHSEGLEKTALYAGHDTASRPDTASWRLRSGPDNKLTLALLIHMVVFRQSLGVLRPLRVELATIHAQRLEDRTGNLARFHGVADGLL